MAACCSRLRRYAIKKFAVILAGGRGERFWPASQAHFPKQFLSVFHNTPLIHQTLERVKPYFRRDERLFIIPKDLRKLMGMYIKKEHMVIEPARRNTAPAICLAAMLLEKKHGNGILHVMPADHLIKPKNSLIAALRFGQMLARRGYLVTYGIPPARPETGYGYLRIGKKISSRKNITAFKGEEFTEKPSLREAKQYIRKQTYLWNSGIFSFSIEAILAEMRRFVPRVYYGVSRFLEEKNTRFFEKIPDISIDYGVMEKSTRLCIVKGNFRWDDVGSWLALERYFRKDRKGNICIGDIKGLEMSNSIMYTNSIPLRVYEVERLVVVVTEDGVLVCSKRSAPDLKRLLQS